MESIRPSRVIINAFKTFPFPAKAATADKPTSIRAKYSADQKRMAKLARAGAKPIRKMAPIVPPEKEEIAAIVKAFPAWPFRAIGYPSKEVATTAASPGALIRIEEVEPPKIAP